MRANYIKYRYSKEEKLAWAEKVLPECCKKCHIWQRWFYEDVWGSTMACGIASCEKPEREWKKWSKLKKLEKELGV